MENNKIIVLKKAKVSKNETNKKIGIDIEYIFKGETKRRELFLTAGLVENLILSSDMGYESSLVLVNDEICNTIRESRYKNYGVKK